MARSIDPIRVSEPDVDAINLRRVLLRLEQQILLSDTSTSSASLLHSSFERDKVAQNLEYARTLLLRIQHNTANAKSHQARRHTQQAELARHRALIRRLTERLYEMRRQDDGDDGRVNSDVPAGENGVYRPLGGKVEASEGQRMNGVREMSGMGEGGEDLLARYFTPEPSLSKQPNHEPTSSSSDGLRSRNVQGTPSIATPYSQPEASMVSSTGSKTDNTQRDQLFGNASTKNGKAKSPQIFETGAPLADVPLEKQLEHQDATQAELTSSLVSLAQQLKASSLAFAAELVVDAEAVDRTEGALGRNQQGLDAASKRMGVLRKMSEGRWWWQRYIMFILLALAWVVQIAIVFVGPKIRF